MTQSLTESSLSFVIRRKLKSSVGLCLLRGELILKGSPSPRAKRKTPATTFVVITGAKVGGENRNRNSVWG